MKLKTSLMLTLAFAGGIAAGYVIVPNSFCISSNPPESKIRSRKVDTHLNNQEASRTFNESAYEAEMASSVDLSHSSQEGNYWAVVIRMRELSALAKRDPEAALLRLTELDDLSPHGRKLASAEILTTVAEHNPEAAFEWMIGNGNRLSNLNPLDFEGAGLERDLWSNVASAIFASRSDSDNSWIKEVISSGSQVGSEVAMEVVSQHDFERAVDLINQNLDKTWVIEDLENGFVKGYLSTSSISSGDEAIRLHDWLSGTFTGRQKRNAENKLLRNLVESGGGAVATEIVKRLPSGPHRRSWEEIISDLPK